MSRFYFIYFEDEILFSKFQSCSNIVDSDKRSLSVKSFLVHRFLHLHRFPHRFLHHFLLPRGFPAEESDDEERMQRVQFRCLKPSQQEHFKMREISRSGPYPWTCLTTEKRTNKKIHALLFVI